MYEDEIIFTPNAIGLENIKITKLDDVYQYRPTVYNHGKILNTLSIDGSEADMFDSIFMSALTSLMLKDFTMESRNYASLLLSIVSFELKITIVETDEIITLLAEYINIFKDIIMGKFLVDMNAGYEILDVNFMYYENKSISYATLGR